MRGLLLSILSSIFWSVYFRVANSSTIENSSTSSSNSTIGYTSSTNGSSGYNNTTSTSSSVSSSVFTTVIPTSTTSPEATHNGVIVGISCVLFVLVMLVFVKHMVCNTARLPTVTLGSYRHLVNDIDEEDVTQSESSDHGSIMSVWSGAPDTPEGNTSDSSHEDPEGMIISGVVDGDCSMENVQFRNGKDLGSI
ncbi:hypothetical protein EDL81_04075 [Ehrlichia ruminantium]|uniref:hypothetical protein n=1 Tax=Ehrlichia ruminantium TaxID=779 RepID=UPI00130E5C98|nr:hypothetical protein [Ehrlichia ruminantium]QGR02794.1 hypothetical protein EDL81_04075 [Ehrlichia ruminantium]